MVCTGVCVCVYTIMIHTCQHHRKVTTMSSWSPSYQSYCIPYIVSSPPSPSSSPPPSQHHYHHHQHKAIIVTIMSSSSLGHRVVITIITITIIPSLPLPSYRHNHNDSQHHHRRHITSITIIIADRAIHAWWPRRWPYVGDGNNDDMVVMSMMVMVVMIRWKWYDMIWMIL